MIYVQIMLETNTFIRYLYKHNLTPFPG